MEIKRCGNCRFWGYYFDGERQESIGGERVNKVCGAVPLYDDVRGWRWDEYRENYVDAPKEGTENLKAFAHDASSYAAYLSTLADFYCNQWENLP